MTDLERARDWANFYRISSPGYHFKALQAVLVNDGEKMLAKVLQELDLERSLELVKDAQKNS